MEVSKTIRAIRERKNLTQVDVASKLGTERSNYARLESRDQNLTIKQISEIATALEVSIYEIIGLPEGADLNQEQSERVRSLEEKLATTEEILKDKKRNIKYYKSFIEWVQGRFNSEFSHGTCFVAHLEEIGKKIDEEGSDFEVSSYSFTEEELRQIGDYMFDYDNDLYMWANFMGETGFITEKWFIDAYKRKNRKEKIKITPSETINWVKSVFEFLEDE